MSTLLNDPYDEHTQRTVEQKSDKEGLKTYSWP